MLCVVRFEASKAVCAAGMPWCGAACFFLSSPFFRGHSSLCVSLSRWMTCTVSDECAEGGAGCATLLPQMTSARPMHQLSRHCIGHGVHHCDACALRAVVRMNWVHGLFRRAAWRNQCATHISHFSVRGQWMVLLSMGRTMMGFKQRRLYSTWDCTAVRCWQDCRNT